MNTAETLSFPPTFAGKTVLVTGAGRGLGFEIATHFARAGATLHLFDIDESLLADATRQLAALGVSVFPTRVDVSRRVEVERAIAAADARAPIDILVNNAGIARESGFLHITEPEWREILEVNLTGLFFVAQSTARLMTARRRGVILNMGSKNALDGESGYAHYNASKGGVLMLTRTMALELAPFGIRVNAICPGYIQTPMSQEIDSPDFVRDFVDRYIPLRRPGRVEDVAPAFLFLASDAASFITGQTLVIDGGQLAGQNPSPALLTRLHKVSSNV